MGEQIFWWVAAGVAAFAGTWLLRGLIARLAKLRAHRQRKHQFLHERRLQGSAARGRGQAAAARAVLPRHAAAIRRSAEQAAQAAGGGERPANPFRRGTREFVLWETSFELAATQWAEQDPPRGWRAPHSISGT